MKPGCPLPWRVVARSNVRAQALTPAIVGKRSYGTREWPIAIVSAISERETDANAAYIVHACNAYPQLVEALRQVLHLAEMEGPPDPTPVQQDAIALLARLGEAAIP